MSRLVVVDDHPVFRKGIVALLRAEGHEVVGEAGDGQEAIALVGAERPDAVLMDLSMPLKDGFEATAHITAAHPNTKVLAITLFDDEASVVRALEVGAAGYVSKQADPAEILAALSAVLQGAQWLGAGITRPTLAPSSRLSLPRLTRREQVIADLVGRGHTNRQIAEQLFLSPKTVANYVSNVLLKLGADSREDAAKMVRAARAAGTDAG
jgi:DNA-binding NarL/FixJ family response regulator